MSAVEADSCPPDCTQLDAVLASVKAWPGQATTFVAADATASLDGGYARRHGTSRSGRRNGLKVEQRNGKKWPKVLWSKSTTLDDGSDVVKLRFSFFVRPMSPFLRPDPWFAIGLVTRRGQGWPLRRGCGVRRRFQAKP
jgi:hypothetical protein